MLEIPEGGIDLKKNQSTGLENLKLLTKSLSSVHIGEEFKNSSQEMKKRSSLFENAGISTIKEEEDCSPNGKINLRHIGSRSGMLSAGSEFKSGSKEEMEDEGVSSLIKASKITSNP